MGSREAEERFLREARAAANLNHPGIVTVHDIGREDGSIYIVADLISGVNLAEWLTGQPDRRVEPRRAAELIAEIADAVHFAHAHGVVHRDLKPHNVLIDDAGRVHVTDFGLAKRDAAEIAITVEGRILGTPQYMSPEQARGESLRVDGRTDVYSLGVMLHEFLAGERPFRGVQRMILHWII
jgi:serine/threonine protein kinase